MIYDLIILSFVVQNFHSTHFLTKTYRYKSFVQLNSVNLYYALAKWNISISLVRAPWTSPLYRMYNSYFVLSFWKNFKNLFNHKLGTSVSNVTKTSYYYVYKNLTQRFSISSNSCVNISQLSDNVYFRPNTLIPFSFNTQVYNTLVFYFISLINTFYSPSQIDFRLYYSFIWRNPNLLTYDFLNRFYFRVKNY